MSNKPKSTINIKAAPVDYFTARKLYEMKFQDATKTIHRMDSLQKAVIATDVRRYLDSLYAAANRFGNEDYPLDEQPTVEQFKGIMGKIKHWETILFWLFEIDIMMEAAELQRLANEADAEIEATRVNGIVTMSDKQLDKRIKIIVKAKEVTPRTDEIVNLAAELTGRFFR